MQLAIAAERGDLLHVAECCYKHVGTEVRCEFTGQLRSEHGTGFDTGQICFYGQ